MPIPRKFLGCPERILDLARYFLIFFAGSGTFIVHQGYRCRIDSGVELRQPVMLVENLILDFRL